MLDKRRERVIERKKGQDGCTTKPTKEQILVCARELFAVKGYLSVSIREISSNVGIKESSIYYHFKNKQEILDELIDRLRRKMEQNKKKFIEQLAGVNEIKKDAFILAGWVYIEYFLLEEETYQTICMLQIEKMRDVKAQYLYQQIVLEQPISHQMNMFSLLKEKGIINTDSDVECLAMEYQSLIIGVFMRYFPNVCDKQQRIEEAKIMLSKLLGQFFDTYVR